MIRLGFAVRSVARPEISPAGGPRRRSHLSVALAELSDMLPHLERIGVRFYRAALAPPAGGLAELADCAAQLEELAARLAASRTRVTLHLDHGVALGAEDGGRAAQAIAVVEAAAALLEALDAGRSGVVEGTMVAHVGGPAGDDGSAGRFAARHRALSARARARLAVEHDGAGHSLGALLGLHRRCGVPVVFDAHHWALHNPERLPLSLALGLALATWPRHTRPEVHLSSARGEAHLLPGRAGGPPRVLPPRPGQHADFVAAGDLERLLVAGRGLPPFDLMIEAKAGDLALLRPRADLARREPTLAARLS
jgi:UV DNA damage endonuclease